jgi:hypothetical protein
MKQEESRTIMPFQELVEMKSKFNMITSIRRFDSLIAVSI